MTTERQPESTPVAPEPGSLEAEIASATQIVEDTTTPEQVAEATEVMDGVTTEAPAVVPEPEATPGPAAGAAEPSVGSVAEAPAQPAETETQQPRTFTQDEWSKRESAYRQQQAQSDQRLAAIEQQQQAAWVEQQVELAAQRAEANLTPQVGSEEARRMARDPATLNDVRVGFATQNENAQLRQALQQSGQQNESQAKATTIQHFATLHNVAEADHALLESATTPSAMEMLAKRLAQPKTAGQKVESKVPAGSTERLETGESEAPPLNDDAREAAINSKNPSDWTPEDIEFQRRRY